MYKDRSRDWDGDWIWKDEYKDMSDLYISSGNQDVGSSNSKMEHIIAKIVKEVKKM